VSDWNFADVWEEIARLQPELPAVLRGDDVRSWGDFDRRADALARRMLNAGLDHQAKVAQYLHNGPEYLESLFSCFKASLVPVNTNYRYVDAELVYLWRDADVEAVVFHGAFSAHAEASRAQLPGIRLWLWVDDGSGACPAWAEPYEAAAGAAVEGPVRGPEGRSGDDLFLLYTGGTTGQPKGVMWRQDDLFAVLNRTAPVRYPEEGGLADVRAQLPPLDEPRTRVLPAAPLMHGTAAFSAFSTMDSCGAVVLTENVRFDAVDILDTLARHRVTEVSIVGDAFAKPLLDQLDANPGRWELSALRVMLSSGVMWSLPIKEGLLRHIPDLLCVDTLGSSEAVGVARSISSTKKAAKTGGFKLGADAQVIRDDGTPVEAGSGEEGLVAVAGRGPVGYYKDPEKTAKTFRMIGGRRWVTPGDHALVHADGTVQLLGRGSSCINTGGEKVFPEEVEEALKLHGHVHDAVVVGVPDPRFGQMVVAVVEPEAGSAPSEDELTEALRDQLAAYKIPRRIVVVDSIGRAPNGKVDQRRWRDEAAKAVGRA
jgi:acyl-CoA synthetase (AMP-forming)/AMP-acid ligase II